jgi:hypothetical protein
MSKAAGFCKCIEMKNNCTSSWPFYFHLRLQRKTEYNEVICRDHLKRKVHHPGNGFLFYEGVESYSLSSPE